MSAAGDRILTEGTARELLDYVRWGWPGRREAVNRLRFYKIFLARIEHAETHGGRAALVILGAEVFATTRRTIRADLKAAADLARIERMAKIPPRPRESAPPA